MSALNYNTKHSTVLMAIDEGEDSALTPEQAEIQTYLPTPGE